MFLDPESYYCDDPKADAKELLEHWLENFDAVSDEEELFRQLADCQDWLPSRTCRLLGLAQGSTYADAVTCLRSQWMLK